MTHQLDADDFFIHRVQEQCAARGMNFFLIEPVWAEAFLHKLTHGEVFPRVLLNMHSEHHLPEDIYTRLLRVAHGKGTQVIDPPDVARTGMKFFSSESALTEAGEFVLIDYVNDQCHLLTQTTSPKMGVPDERIAAIARRLVEGAQALILKP